MYTQYFVISQTRGAVCYMVSGQRQCITFTFMEGCMLKKRIPSDGGVIRNYQDPLRFGGSLT